MLLLQRFRSLVYVLKNSYFFNCSELENGDDTATKKMVLYKLTSEITLANAPISFIIRISIGIVVILPVFRKDDIYDVF